jgi:hypothetical protein
MTRFEIFLKESDLTNLRLAKELYLFFKSLEIDPISIEFQIINLQKKNKLITKNQLNQFAKKISEVFPVISYDEKLMILRILPNDFTNIMDTIKINEESLNESINNKMQKNPKRNNAEVEKYSVILKQMYSNAPKGYQMTFVHLFGIKYSKELEKISLKQVAKLATGKESLGVEINKGMKLHNYVTINDIEKKYDTNTNKETYFKNLYMELDLYRVKEAKKVNKDVRSIFDDKTINELIKILPLTYNELISVYGFGPYKTDLYGKDIFRIIGKYRDRIKPGDYNYSDIPELKANRKWTLEEDLQLKTEVRQGLTNLEIADTHKRTIGGIIARRDYLNI